MVAKVVGHEPHLLHQGRLRSLSLIQLGLVLPPGRTALLHHNTTKIAQGQSNAAIRGNFICVLNRQPIRWHVLSMKSLLSLACI